MAGKEQEVQLLFLSTFFRSGVSSVIFKVMLKWWWLLKLMKSVKGNLTFNVAKCDSRAISHVKEGGYRQCLLDKVLLANQGSALCEGSALF